MGCVPSHKVEKSTESKETICSPKNKSKSKEGVFIPQRPRVVKSRFLSKMLKFKSDLNVIYEIPSELEISILKE